MADLTQLLSAAQAGDPAGAEQLLPLVYAELRQLAAARLKAEPSGQTLQPTALVHEAYLRLLGPEGAPLPWDHRGHFFAAAAESMRRILIENARRKKRLKRNAGVRRQLGEGDAIAAPDAGADPLDLLALDEALEELGRHDPTAAMFVKLRYFAGLSHDEAADALGISRRVADRSWSLSRAWLRRQMDAE